MFPKVTPWLYVFLPWVPASAALYWYPRPSLCRSIPAASQSRPSGQSVGTFECRWTATEGGSQTCACRPASTAAFANPCSRAKACRCAVQYLHGYVEAEVTVPIVPTMRCRAHKKAKVYDTSTLYTTDTQCLHAIHSQTNTCTIVMGILDLKNVFGRAAGNAYMPRRVRVSLLLRNTHPTAKRPNTRHAPAVPV